MTTRAAVRAGWLAAFLALLAPLSAHAHPDPDAPRVPFIAPPPPAPRADGVPQLLRGPYLQIATPTSVRVRWRTDVPVTGIVRHGPAPNDLPNTTSETSARTEHEVVLTGLSPDTRVYYAVGVAGLDLAGADEHHFVDTHPLSGTSAFLRIWAIGDSGLPGPNAVAVRDAYADFAGETHTDVWLMLGDNAYNDGSDAEYQVAVFDMYADFLRNTVLWPTRGNHDRPHDGPFNDYYELFSLPAAGQAGGLPSGTEAYYAYDYANVHFICLDSFESNRASDAPMATWLANDLAGTSQQWIIAYWHHPPYSKGSHDSDTEPNLVDMRTNLLPVLEEGGVDLVLSGHSHSYERSFLIDGHYGPSGTLRPTNVLDASTGSPFDGSGYVKPTNGLASHEGTVYTVAGSASRTGGGPLNHPIMVTSLDELGSLVVDVWGNVLSAKFLDAAGDVRDDFVIVKGPPAVDTGEPPAPPSAPFAAYPQPARRTVSVSFETHRAGRVRAHVYDAAGRRIRTLRDDDEAAGTHTSTWDLTDADGRRVSPGVYFLRVRTDEGARATRIVVTGR